MLVGTEELCHLIPHAGTMCLLEEVIEWGDDFVLCQTRSHLHENNPLRCTSGLSALQGIEYGMQSMAVHGGLLAQKNNQTAPPGFAAALRDVTLHVEWLDIYKHPLQVYSKALVLDAGSYIYQFEIKCEQQLLLQGRATIMSQLRSHS